MRCPNCRKENTLRSWEGTETIGGVELFVHGERCSSCGETLFDADEVMRQERAIALAYVERGVRAANEFKLVRKVSGLQAKEVADLLGVRPETVSRWERGEADIPRAAAFALGELMRHPRTARQQLEAFARAV